MNKTPMGQDTIDPISWMFEWAWHVDSPTLPAMIFTL